MLRLRREIEISENVFLQESVSLEHARFLDGEFHSVGAKDDVDVILEVDYLQKLKEHLGVLELGRDLHVHCSVQYLSYFRSEF